MAQKLNRTEIIGSAEGETLAGALRRHYGNASPTLYSQAKHAVWGVLLAEYGPDVDLEDHAKRTRCDDIGDRAIQRATSAWYHEGLSPATINKRLNCLSKMGVNVDGLRVKNPKQLKWHLKEGDKPAVVAWCQRRAYETLEYAYDALGVFIQWTTLTGLRIEESLRLTWPESFGHDFSEVHVPGLKTAKSQAALPLGESAKQVLKEWRSKTPNFYGVFDVSYEDLHAAWQEVREHFGWKDDPTATLKALRRSAARYLHVDCGMPLHMVQQYLRHESMDTTLEYLRLTGGYGTEEMRRFLK